jgi:carbon storage regulator
MLAPTCAAPAIPRVLFANEEGLRMLVLTRKSNQSIMIGDDIEVSVLSVMGDKVRIGIRAPQDIPVFRTEIYLEIQRDGTGDQPAGKASEGKPRDVGAEVGKPSNGDNR